MKRNLFLLIALFIVLLLVFTSCGNTENTDTSKDSNVSTDSQTHSHTFGDWITVTEPTCKNEGLKKQECSCGASNEETIQTLEHTEKVLKGYPSTCVEIGYSDGIICSVCQTIIVSRTELPLSDHTPADITPKPSTCIEHGYENGVMCSVCEIVIVEPTELPLTNCTPTTVEAKDPTCLEEGFTSYEKCEVCEKNLTEPVSVPVISCNIVNGFCTMCKNSYVSDGIIYKFSDDGSYVIIADIGECEDAIVHIPEIYDDLPIKEIGREAFKNVGYIKEVYLPTTIEIIGESAFENCLSLEKIFLPNSLKYTKNGSFRNCPTLKEVHFNGTVEEWCIIDFGAFMPLCNYADLYIGNELFTSLVITDSITKISQYAFAECTSLNSITVNKLEKFPQISGGAFNNSSLRRLYISDIENWCNFEFADSYSNPMRYVKNIYLDGEILENLIISDTITKINNYAFYNCTSLTSIEIPNSVISIGNSAFYGCSILTDIDIPNSVISIGSGAFSNCSGITSITLPFVGNGNDVTYLGYVFGASSYSNNKTYVPSSLKTVTITGGTSIGEGAFYNCSTLTSIEISSGVTIIGDSAFRGCSNLTRIEIPNSVTIIGDSAFRDCSNLTRIEIPNSVTSIGDSAFYNCSSLTNVEIPNSVTSIGDYAFIYCSNLTNVKIPNSVTIIGDSAFRDCSNLTSVEISSGVINIGDYAFENCSSLENLYVNDIESWCNINFTTISSNPMSRAKNIYFNGKILENLVIPNTVTTIKNYSFFNCSTLTSIEIPNSVTSIGNSAFYNCSNLASIEISSSVTSIGKSALYGCNALESITLPFTGKSRDATAYEAVFGYIFGYTYTTMYGSDTYWSYSSTEFKNIQHSSVNGAVWQYSCYNSQSSQYIYYLRSYFYYIPSSLKNVTITDATTIPISAFNGCTSLTSIEIPKSVTSIGNYAFSGCSNLISIEIPKSVTSIGNYAFSGCSKLTIYCEANSKPANWNSYWNYSNCPVVWGYKGE